MSHSHTIPWRSARRILAVLASFAMVLSLGPLLGTATAQDQPEARAIDDGGVCDPENTEESPFTDKPEDERGDAIDCLWTYGITEGVSEDEYGFEEDITRQQMVSFLANVLRAADQHDVNESPAAADWSDRDQIANDHVTNADITNEEGISQGYDDNHFHPRPGAPSCGDTEDHFGECGVVNRASMASFIVRTGETIADAEIAPDAQDWFQDECPNPHEDNVDKLAEVGVVEGRQAGFYDCLSNTRRDQMALFIARTMDYLDEEHSITFTPVEDGEEGPAEVVGATFNDNDESGGLNSGDDVVLEFSSEVEIGTSVEIIDDTGNDRTVLNDDSEAVTADDGQTHTEFTLSDDGTTVTGTLQEDPDVDAGDDGDGQIQGTVSIGECTEIRDAETGEPVDCEGAEASFTVEAPMDDPVSDDATVTNDEETTDLPPESGTASDDDVWRVIFSEVMDPVDGDEVIRVADGDGDQLDLACEPTAEAEDDNGVAECAFNNERVQVGEETYEPGRVLEVILDDESTFANNLQTDGGGDGVLNYPAEIVDSVGFTDQDGDGEWNVEASPDTTLEAEGDTSDQPTEDPATGEDPPELATAERSGSQELTLTWSEPIDVIGTADQVTVHADSTENDCSGTEVTTGEEVSSDDGDETEVVSLADALDDETTYEVLVEVDHVEDQEGNNNAEQCVEFTTGTTA